jgi:nucleoside-diphosphate-sugar epimerase
VLKATGSKSALRFAPLPQDDPARRQPDITRARTLLGWEPQIALADGLIKSLPYFQATLS